MKRIAWRTLAVLVLAATQAAAQESDYAAREAASPGAALFGGGHGGELLLFPIYAAIWLISLPLRLIGININPF